MHTRPSENLIRSQNCDPYFEQDILPKVIDSFYNRNSSKFMKFIQTWKVINSNSEAIYIKRRQKMKKQMDITENYGFLYYTNVSKVIDIAQGNVQMGNLNESLLASASQGVSICKHADIYHPGNSMGKVPLNGTLLILKYIRGRVKYVVGDQNPLDPQPQYNSHAMRSSVLNMNTKTYDAFHMTQVFAYEYTEDGDIVRMPSQILPVAAVEFDWNGDYIFRSNPNISKVVQPNRPTFRAIANNDSHQKSNKRSNIHSRDATIWLKNEIKVMKENVCPTSCTISCYIYFYLLKRAVFPFMYQIPLIISDLIEMNKFKEELNHIQFFLHEKINPNEPINLLNSLNILPTEPFYLGPQKKNYGASILRLKSDDNSIFKFITYFRVVPEEKDKKTTEILIKLLNVTSSVARIKFKSTFNSQLYIFPDGKFSSSLGLTSVPMTESYLHGLVLTQDPPEFILFHDTKDIQKEKESYYSDLHLYEQFQVVQQSARDRRNLEIPLDILRRSGREQADFQSQLFTQLARGKVISSPHGVGLHYSNFYPIFPVSSVIASSPGNSPVQTPSSCNTPRDIPLTTETTPVDNGTSKPTNTRSQNDIMLSSSVLPNRSTTDKTSATNCVNNLEETTKHSSTIESSIDNHYKTQNTSSQQLSSNKSANETTACSPSQDNTKGPIHKTKFKLNDKGQRPLVNAKKTQQKMLVKQLLVHYSVNSSKASTPNPETAAPKCVSSEMEVKVASLSELEVSSAADTVMIQRPVERMHANVAVVNPQKAVRNGVDVNYANKGVAIYPKTSEPAEKNAIPDFILEPASGLTDIMYSSDDNGVFRRLSFVNENVYTIDGIDRHNYLKKSRYLQTSMNQKCWTFDRKKFCRLKDLPGLSLFEG